MIELEPSAFPSALTALEWGGAATGLLGAFLLATHTRVSPYGWIAFLVANVLLAAFALGIERYGLLTQQLGFTATSLLGVYRAGFFRSWGTAAKSNGASAAPH